jgi:hypothetical protein
VKSKATNILIYLICIITSVILGWISTLGGIENDYVQKLSINVIPLLLTLLVLYSTLTIHLINELRKIGNKNVSSVVNALKSNIIFEIVIVVFLFVVLICKSCLLCRFPCYSNLIQIATNSTIVFAFLFFIWVIVDVTMGLYELVVHNLNNNND